MWLICYEVFQPATGTAFFLKLPSHWLNRLVTTSHHWWYKPNANCQSLTFDMHSGACDIVVPCQFPCPVLMVPDTNCSISGALFRTNLLSNRFSSASCRGNPWRCPRKSLYQLTSIYSPATIVTLNETSKKVWRVKSNFVIESEMHMPGHQQLWYWLHQLGRSLSSMRKDFYYLCHVNVEEW